MGDRVKITSVLFSHEPNKAFLIPDSYRATKVNSTDVTDGTNETILFSDNFQNKYNIRISPLNIEIICTRCETG